MTIIWVAAAEPDNRFHSRYAVAPGSGSGGEAAGIDGEGSSEDGKLFIRGFECMGACDLAPMASIDERYYGPLSEEDAKAATEQLRSGGEVLPDKRLEDRKLAGGPDAKEVEG